MAVKSTPADQASSLVAEYDILSNFCGGPGIIQCLNLRPTRRQDNLRYVSGISPRRVSLRQDRRLRQKRQSWKSGEVRQGLHFSPFGSSVLRPLSRLHPLRYQAGQCAPRSRWILRYEYCRHRDGEGDSGSGRRGICRRI
ncbi:hypothetical protein LINGRAHAP2_LOCUS12051 [Linum grandiflorum]